MEKKKPKVWTITFIYFLFDFFLHYDLFVAIMLILLKFV